MADDAQSIRSLNWRELFPFINIFRAFRIAIHPSKLLLGFALLLLLYGGGRFLDLVWPSSYYTSPKEIDAYDEYRWSDHQTESFDTLRENLRNANAENYAQKLMGNYKWHEDTGELPVHVDEHATPPTPLPLVEGHEAAYESALRGKFHSQLQANIVFERNRVIESAPAILKEKIDRATKDRDEALKNANEELKTLKTNHDAHILTDKAYNDAVDANAKRQRAANDTYTGEVRKATEASDSTLRRAREQALDDIRKLDNLTPKPIFTAFFDYEVHQFHNVVASVMTRNWLNGIATGTQPTPDVPNVGVAKSLVNFVVIGPLWLLRYHTIFFIILAAWALAVWAIFGGAIARISAVHVARDEKISIRQALRFSWGKSLSFIFAPLIPLIIILAAGVIVAIGGMLMYIPYIGPILAGVLFVLALLAGFIMTLVGTGTLGGFNLMYPTIAVEGSDSFDAISRSFSYVFARPWRKLFYTAVAIAYGALCFLFVRYFIYVMLALTHFFVQWFLGGRAAIFWPEIWPPVTDQNLAYDINYQALKWSDAAAAFLIQMWVYAVLTLLGAFVISFYFSANTIIYYLMRREVDATELDDVYVEETEDDFTDAAASISPGPVATTPAASTPAAEKPIDPPAAPATT